MPGASGISQILARLSGAVILILVSVTSAMTQNATGPTVSLELAAQKARMLESFLISAPITRALAKNPDQVRPLVDEAHAELEAGDAALVQSQPVEASNHFDRGLKALARAAALDERGTPSEQQNRIAQRDRIASYLDAFAESSGLADVEMEQLTALRMRLDRAKAGTSTDQELSVLFDDTIEFASRVTRGRTLIVSRTFETPEEEYAFELRRHDDYRLLIRMAVVERAGSEPHLEEIVKKLTSEADRLRNLAAQSLESGDAGKAVELMERATARLSVVLRSAGLLVME